jgi:Porin subfamily
MSRNRTIATLAALGGFTAAMALLSGLPAAKADELSDLRANQQLLEQRLDQLAQIQHVPGGVYPYGPTAKTAGAGLVGGSFPRSFLIPGTDTSIRVGGEVRTIVDYWFNGGPAQANQNTTVGNNGEALSAPLHVHVAPGDFQRSRGNSVFQMSARESKVNIETRTPTAFGEARTFIEWDFTNDTADTNLAHVADNFALRLRYAYGTLGGILAGQANSNFSDSDAGSETIDFGGNVGNQGVVRLPQIRYTMPLAGWGLPGAFSVSAEVPETDTLDPAGVRDSDNTSTGYPAKASAPDLTMAWYIPQPWGHMDFATVVRPGLEIKDGQFVDKSYIGFGGAFGGDVKPHWFGWMKDGFTFRFVAGEGLGRYNNNGGDFALVSNFPNATTPLSAAQAANLLVKPATTWGGDVGYRHFWEPNLRSTASFGIYHMDTPNNLRTILPTGFTSGVSALCPASIAATATGGNCATNKEVITTHINLIWSPVPFVDVGVEYVWAHRVVLSNLKGDENALIGKFGVKF